MKIPDALPNVRNSSSERISVQFEYCEAEQTTPSASEAGRHVLLIIGHPGICVVPSSRCYLQNLIFDRESPYSGRLGEGAGRGVPGVPLPCQYELTVLALRLVVVSPLESHLSIFVMCTICITCRAKYQHHTLRPHLMRARTMR